MKHINGTQTRAGLESLLWRAWEAFLDEYEENPTTYEPQLIVKLGGDLSEARICSTDLSPFIDRKRNFVHPVEFTHDGKPSNFGDIAREHIKS